MRLSLFHSLETLWRRLSAYSWIGNQKRAKRGSLNRLKNALRTQRRQISMTQLLYTQRVELQMESTSSISKEEPSWAAMLSFPKFLSSIVGSSSRVVVWLKVYLITCSVLHCLSAGRQSPGCLCSNQTITSFNIISRLAKKTGRHSCVLCAKSWERLAATNS